MESSKRYYWFGITVLVIMAAGAGFSLPAVVRATGAVSGQVTGDSLVTGAAAAAFQHDFEQQHPLREPLVGLWGSLRFALFREGVAGVVVGENDWLFSAEEFVVLADEQQ